MVDLSKVRSSSFIDLGDGLGLEFQVVGFTNSRGSLIQAMCLGFIIQVMD